MEHVLSKRVNIFGVGGRGQLVRRELSAQRHQPSHHCGQRPCVHHQCQQAVTSHHQDGGIGQGGGAEGTLLGDYPQGHHRRMCGDVNQLQVLLQLQSVLEGFTHAF